MPNATLLSATPIQCNGCKETFSIMLREVATAAEGLRIDFVCPHCGKQYLVAEFTKRGVALRQQLIVLRNRIKNTQPEAVKAGIDEQIGHLWEQHGELQAALKKETVNAPAIR